MKKKILIGTVNLDIGGIEKTLIGLLNNIDYKKYSVDLLLLKTDGVLKKEVNKNVNIITPYRSKFIERIANSKNIFNKIIKHLLFNYFTVKLWDYKSKEYDVAISYSGYYPFIDKFIGLSNSKNKLIWVHTDLKTVYDTDRVFRIRMKYTKNKYNYFNKIICVSESVKESFIKFFNIEKNKVVVQWNILNIKKSEGAYPKLKGDFKIISVGRLIDSKRFDKLVQIHKKLRKDKLNVMTYIVGSGEEENNLRKLIKDNNIEDSFILLGYQENVIEIIKQADLFVSTSDYEGLPTVLLETLHAGVPFVAPEVAGIKDVANYIAPKNSYMLTNKSIEGLYNGVLKMLKNNTKNKFKFKIETYNKKCIDSFYDIIEKQKKE